MNKNIKKIGVAIAILGIVGIISISIAAMAAVPMTPATKGGGGGGGSGSGVSGIYGMYDPTSHHFTNGSQFQQISNYTFQLPSDSYVYIEGSGLLGDVVPGLESVYMQIDSDSGSSVRRQYTCDASSPGGCNTGFQLSRVYKLSKGSHTVYLYAWSVADGLNQNAQQITISVIVSQGGAIEIRK